MVHLLPPDPKIALGCAHLKSAAKGQCLRRHSDCKHAERSSNGDGLLLAIPLGTHETQCARDGRHHRARTRPQPHCALSDHRVGHSVTENTSASDTPRSSLRKFRRHLSCWNLSRPAESGAPSLGRIGVMGRPSKYPDELRDCAVRMVAEVRRSASRPERFEWGRRAGSDCWAVPLVCRAGRNPQHAHRHERAAWTAAESHERTRCRVCWRQTLS